MENQNPNGPYQAQPAAAYRNPIPYPDAAPLSVGDYLIMMIVSFIPAVNLILLCVWAFGDANLNRKNFALAQLIGLAIVLVLGFAITAAVSFALISPRK